MNYDTFNYTMLQTSPLISLVLKHVYKSQKAHHIVAGNQPRESKHPSKWIGIRNKNTVCWIQKPALYASANAGGSSTRQRPLS
jgi:hypothetical protein